MPEDIALFIDFENIRYSMLNIQRREPDPQELIAVARRYGTVMVARAYADWSRQPEPFKGSLTAAMIDRVDCPAKQRDRIRMGTVHYGNSPTSALGSAGLTSEGSASYSPAPGSYAKQWPSGISGNSGPLPAITPQSMSNGWPAEQDTSLPSQQEADESTFSQDEQPTEEQYGIADYPRESYRQSPSYSTSYGASPSGPLGQGGTGPLGYSNSYTSTGNTGHMPAINTTNGGTGPIQSTVIQSTVDLNMLMDIIETVFDRPTISTFVLMTGDKDFTRISARLKLRLNKTVIVVGIPGTVSRDLISSANQFVPLVPSGTTGAMGAIHTMGGTGNTGALPAISGSFAQQQQPSSSPMSSGNTGAMPAINFQGGSSQFQSPFGTPSMMSQPPMDVLDPQFLQFLDYIDRNWSWRTVIGVSNFIGDPVNPKNRFRGRLTRESARELLNACIQQGILLLQTDATGAEDLRLNRAHPGVDEVLKQFVR